MVYINTHNINFTQYAQYTQYTHCTVCAIYTVYCALFTEAVCNRRSALVCRLPFDFISQADTNWFSGGRDQVKHLLVETSGMQPIKTEPNAKISAVWRPWWWCAAKSWSMRFDPECSGALSNTLRFQDCKIQLMRWTQLNSDWNAKTPDKTFLHLHPRIR